ncbi:MAG TPA: hypothetical protein VIK69_02105 [Methylophilaceae bacterium]
MKALAREMFRTLRRWWLRKRIEWAEEELADIDLLRANPRQVIAYRAFISAMRRELERLQ